MAKTVPDGADGEDGATGADGFTPIIGVDADGYWTVVTTEGGTPVRIQDVNGNGRKSRTGRRVWRYS